MFKSVTNYCKACYDELVHKTSWPTRAELTHTAMVVLSASLIIAVKKWYVLRAVSGKEAKVKEYIEAELKHNALLSTYVSQVLIPMEKHATLRNGKRVVKEKIALPGYVLVEAELKGDVAHTLRFVPNVLGFLGGEANPTPVRQSDVNRILGTAEETELAEEVNIPFSVDETVKVTDGPFSGFSGVIEEVNTEKHKLKVMVKIFGRKTPLELGFMQVAKE